MVDRAYIIPRRTDLAGMNIQVTDLVPNTSLRNSVIDPQGQSGYLSFGWDVPGTTTVNGDSYVSGSIHTVPLTALADDDTTGGGNDVAATTVATFGLAAYIRERVQPGGVVAAAANPATPGEAAGMAGIILTAVEAGVDLTLAQINTLLSVIVASTDLNGASGDSLSFGSVEDILRILSGEVYRSRAHTIVGVNGGGAFLNEADRDVLVAAQDVVANGGTTFYATGDFLARDEDGFQDIRRLVLTGALRISAAEGVLSHLAGPIAFNNPSYSYAAGSSRERAQDMFGNNLGTDGSHPVCAVFDYTGVRLTPANATESL